MTNKACPARLSTRCDPPWVPVTQEYATVSCVVNVRLDEGVELETENCRVVLANVGRPKNALKGQIPTISGAVEYMAPAEHDDEASSGYFSSICDVISASTTWCNDRPDDYCHFVILVHEPKQEDPQRLGNLIDQSSREQTRFDVVATADGLDLRLLSQAAVLMGGEFIAPTSAGLNLEHLSLRLGDLSSQLVSRMAVSFQWAPAVLPVHLFSAGRHPLFLRDLGGESSPYAHRFYVGPLCAKNRSISFAFRCLVRRKQPGEYLVAKVDVSGFSGGQKWSQELMVVQGATTCEATSRRADPQVGLIMDRLRPTLWWEEICHAFTREDGNHIVRTFERLISHEFEHGRLDAVETLSKVRMEFIRGGYFGLDALGQLWPYTHRQSEDLVL